MSEANNDFGAVSVIKVAQNEAANEKHNDDDDWASDASDESDEEERRRQREVNAMQHKFQTIGVQEGATSDEPPGDQSEFDRGYVEALIKSSAAAEQFGTLSTLRALNGLAETADALTTLIDLSSIIRRPSGRGELNNAARETLDKVVRDNAAKLIDECFPNSARAL